jgi:hypothetical protein
MLPIGAEGSAVKAPGLARGAWNFLKRLFTRKAAAKVGPGVAEAALPAAKSLGAAAANKATVLQSGGNTIKRATAKALNKGTGMDLDRREWGRALEALKVEHGLPPGHHGSITSSGDYLDKAGKVIDSLLGYVP